MRPSPPSPVPVRGRFALHLEILPAAGLESRGVETVRAACLGAEWMARFVIVPLCLASLVSGAVQSLCTPWGLVRHHWVLAKLFITVLSTVILFVHMGPIAYLARTAAGPDLRRHRSPRDEVPAHRGCGRCAAGVGRGDGAVDLQAEGHDPFRPVTLECLSGGGVGATSWDGPRPSPTTRS